MWIFTTQGFYSAVEHREDPDRLIVRARTREDIEALRGADPGPRAVRGRDRRLPLARGRPARGVDRRSRPARRRHRLPELQERRGPAPGPRSRRPLRPRLERALRPPGALERAAIRVRSAPAARRLAFAWTRDEDWEIDEEDARARLRGGQRRALPSRCMRATFARRRLTVAYLRADLFDDGTIGGMSFADRSRGRRLDPRARRDRVRGLRLGADRRLPRRGRREATERAIAHLGRPGRLSAHLASRPDLRAAAASRRCARSRSVDCPTCGHRWHGRGRRFWQPSLGRPPVSATSARLWAPRSMPTSGASPAPARDASAAPAASGRAATDTSPPMTTATGGIES